MTAYTPARLLPAKHKLSPESWGKLVHRDEDRRISTMLAAGWRDIVATKAVPHKKLGVRLKDRRPLESDPLMFSKLFYYVAQVLDVALPDLFLVEDDKGSGIQISTAIDKRKLYPSFLVRPHLMQGKTEREIAFVIASSLTFMRPEYYPKAVLTRDELAAAAATTRLDLDRWANAVEITSQRAGLLVCGDLQVAVAGTQNEAHRQALAAFATSEEYLAIRAQLGLTAV